MGLRIGQVSTVSPQLVVYTPASAGIIPMQVTLTIRRVGEAQDSAAYDAVSTNSEQMPQHYGLVFQFDALLFDQPTGRFYGALSHAGVEFARLEFQYTGAAEVMPWMQVSTTQASLPNNVFSPQAGSPDPYTLIGLKDTPPSYAGSRGMSLVVNETETGVSFAVINPTAPTAPGGSGEPGADGKSAYALAVEQGYNGSLNQWLASLKGSPGDPGSPGEDGIPGASAYQVAVDNGYVGTEAEWMATLKGDPGEPGPSGGTDGKSAYQIAVDNGFVGTEAEWLASLKGADGAPGGGGSGSGGMVPAVLPVGVMEIGAISDYTMGGQGVSSAWPLAVSEFNGCVYTMSNKAGKFGMLGRLSLSSRAWEMLPVLENIAYQGPPFWIIATAQRVMAYSAATTMEYVMPGCTSSWDTADQEYHASWRVQPMHDGDVLPTGDVVNVLSKARVPGETGYAPWPWMVYRLPSGAANVYAYGNTDGFIGFNGGGNNWRLKYQYTGYLRYSFMLGGSVYLIGDNAVSGDPEMGKITLVSTSPEVWGFTPKEPPSVLAGAIYNCGGKIYLDQETSVKQYQEAGDWWASTAQDPSNALDSTEVRGVCSVAGANFAAVWMGPPDNGGYMQTSRLWTYTPAGL